MIDDAEGYCPVWEERKIKHARKDHKCSECGRIIQRGEPYRSVFLVCEKEAQTCHICQHCEVAADWLQRNCGGFLVHGIVEDIEQHTEVVSALSLRRMLWGMGHKWQRKGALMPLPKSPPDYEVQPEAVDKPKGDPLMEQGNAE